MDGILSAIFQNIFVIGLASVGGWLIFKNIRQQMESEDTDARDK